MAPRHELRSDVAWLLHMTNHMLRCRSVAALLDLAYEGIRDGLGYDRVGLVLVDYERRTLAECLGTDEAGRKFYPRDRVWSLDDPNVRLSLLTDPRMQPTGPGFVYFSDASRELPEDARRYLDGRPSQTLRVALRTAEKVLGLISVDNLTSGQPITPEHAPPLVAFANALAAAVENVRLIEERERRIDDLDADLRHRVEQLTWLQEAATRMALPHDLDSVLDTVYACVHTGLGYDRVGIVLIEPSDDGRPVMHEVRGTDEQGRPTRGRPGGPFLDDPDLPIHSPDVSYLQQGHAFYYCADRWAATPPAHREGLEGRMREQLAVALRHDGGLLGYLSVDNLLSNRPIVEADAAPLVAFAAQAALAISRAQVLLRERAARREAEAHARQLDAIFESVADGVFVFGGEGQVLHMNAAARALLVLDAPAAFFAAPLPEPQWPFVRVLHGEVLTGAQAVDLMVRRKDGEERELNVSGAPVRDEEGQIVGAVCVVRDVTERRRLERRTQQALEALVAMAQAVVLTPHPADPAAHHAQEETRAMGQRLAELTRRVLGCQRVSIVAVEPQTGLQHPVAAVGLSPEHERVWWTSVEGTPMAGPQDTPDPSLIPRLLAGEVVTIDMTQPSWKDRPNRYGVRTVLVAPMRVGHDLVGVLSLDYGGADHTFTPDEIALAGAVAQLAALTIERERLLRKRAEAQASEMALREANRRMDDFLAIASHELKTPLTSLKGAIQLAERHLTRSMEDGAADMNVLLRALGAAQRMLQRADQQVDRMDRLAGDLVDVSRIQAGHLEMHMAPCDLAAVVRDAVEEQRLATPARRIALDMPPEGTVPVIADADRIGQVVTNYLTNALKYSAPDQHVHMGLEMDGATARVWVRDEGPGLPMAEQEHIWERFYRAPGIEYRSGSGIGLGMGLYISRTIVERHQGRVGVESSPGAGSTFWFTLPLTPPAS